jgi:hypothetical protein
MSNNPVLVFRIRDILVRIRILGSVPLTNESRCESDLATDPALFVSDLQDVHKKYLYAFKGTFTSFFACFMKDPEPDPDPDPLNKLWIRMLIQEAQKHTMQIWKSPSLPNPKLEK